MYLIKNTIVYAPKCLGKKDVLIGGGNILKIGTDLPAEKAYDVTVIDGTGKILIPGLIDSHVHILGGGGEGGAKTRTPEIMLSDIIKGGVTTVVGCLGTDGCTRTMSNLLAKAKGLEEEGITTYAYTGSYQVPVRTITGNILDDIILFDRIIGTGEIAVSDHRSSQPSKEEFEKIVSATRVGGILSAKAGIVNVHMGDGKRKMELLCHILEETEIPASNILPTHINRSTVLMEEGIQYAKKYNGYIDFTTSFDVKDTSSDGVKASTALKMAWNAGVSFEQITFSSDAQGSLPMFDENGNYIGLGVGSIQTLYREMKDAVLEEHIPLEDALMPVTQNPATVLKLSKKGKIQEGFDADLVMADANTLEIDSVFAKGQRMMKESECIIKGTFE